jgi:hypothetical protein
MRAAADFRREVQPLTDALATGQFSQEDLRHAAALLAARYAPDADAAAGALLAGAKGCSGDAEDLELDDCAEDSPGGRGSTSGSPAVFRGGAGGGGGSRGRELMGRLLRAPFGEVLLSRAAAGLLAWAAPETEYGRCVGVLTALRVGLARPVECVRLSGSLCCPAPNSTPLLRPVTRVTLP